MMGFRTSRLLLAGALLGAGLSVSGCQNKSALSGATDPMSTASLKDSTEPSFRRTQALASAFNKDPSNVKTGMAYAKSLEQIGQKEDRYRVLATIAEKNRKDIGVQAEIGKELLKSGRAAQALPMLEIAGAAPDASWQTLSALGSAYDQQGRYALARQQYQSALAKSPDEVAVMNNLAMSHSLEGNLPEAERILREAVNKPGSKNFQRVRQNLALVVGLQGRFDEARKIASEDLPPEQVEANMAYLQEMLAQQNTWAKIAEDES